MLKGTSGHSLSTYVTGTQSTLFEARTGCPTCSGAGAFVSHARPMPQLPQQHVTHMWCMQAFIAAEISFMLANLSLASAILNTIGAIFSSAGNAVSLSGSILSKCICTSMRRELHATCLDLPCPLSAFPGLQIALTSARNAAVAANTANQRSANAGSSASGLEVPTSLPILVDNVQLVDQLISSSDQVSRCVCPALVLCNCMAQTRQPAPCAHQFQIASPFCNLPVQSAGALGLGRRFTGAHAPSC